MRAVEATTPYDAAASNQLVTDVRKGRSVHGRTFDAIAEGLGLYAAWDPRRASMAFAGLFNCCDMIHPTEQTIFSVVELVEAHLVALLPVEKRQPPPVE